jgi:hypothetical protein
LRLRVRDLPVVEQKLRILDASFAATLGRIRIPCAEDRPYVLQGDTAKAKAAYQDFLALWKGADPDIPILKEAKAEYAKLQ